MPQSKTKRTIMTIKANPSQERRLSQQSQAMQATLRSENLPSEHTMIPGIQRPNPSMAPLISVP